jgi:archaellum component FlaF (FlaF/FlaG flagellin family)
MIRRVFEKKNPEVDPTYLYDEVETLQLNVNFNLLGMEVTTMKHNNILLVVLLQL